MNQQILYIGQDEQLAHHLTGILLNKLSESPYIFKNHTEAANWLVSHPDVIDPILLYERQSLQSDIRSIKFLRSMQTQVYILLVTDDLPDSDRMHYIQAGVNDTVSPSAGLEEFTGLFQFIQKYKPNGQYNKRIDFPDVGSFKMPIPKRVFDVLISFFALLFLSPLLLLVSLAIRLESKGPIFYKSKRVGSNYHIFDFWKFRSMYVDADKRLKEMGNLNQYASDVTDQVYQSLVNAEFDLQDLDLSDESFLVDDEFIIPEEDYVAQNRQKTDNAFVKIEKDPRVTKVGQFIRKYSIDELPQLINILKGDMSIVGNRPLPLYEAELLTKDNSVERFIAPAGLTGLWQVQKRGDAGKLSAEERKQLDIYYAQHYSLWLDIKIIFRTFTAFIQKEDV
ncbi:MAG: sugar transferase [Anaerolineaceae bacterium]|nr:sugar transferase [Anaerolineaceae bacterium]